MMEAAEREGLAESLQEQLDRLQRETTAKLPPEIVETMRRSTEELVRSGIAEQSLRPGDQAPDFELPNAVGRMVGLSTLLVQGPAVVTFYRGAW